MVESWIRLFYWQLKPCTYVLGFEARLSNMLIFRLNFLKERKVQFIFEIWIV